MDGVKKGKFALLPCGKCEYCRKQMADQWATRIELEAKKGRGVENIPLFVTIIQKIKNVENLSFQHFQQVFDYRDWETDRKSTRLNSSHSAKSRMPSSA